jgi:hypothetical protein
VDQNHEGALKQENVLFNLKQSYVSEKERENQELGKILKQQLAAESRNR